MNSFTGIFQRFYVYFKNTVLSTSCSPHVLTEVPHLHQILRSPLLPNVLNSCRKLWCVPVCQKQLWIRHWKHNTFWATISLEQHQYLQYHKLYYRPNDSHIVAMMGSKYQNSSIKLTSVMGKADVLEANTQCSGVTASTSFKTLCLILISSNTASITISVFSKPFGKNNIDSGILSPLEICSFIFKESFQSILE